MHICLHTSMHTYFHAFHTHMHTYIHALHTYIQLYMCVHTCMLQGQAITEIVLIVVSLLCPVLWLRVSINRIYRIVSQSMKRYHVLVVELELLLHR